MEATPDDEMREYRSVVTSSMMREMGFLGELNLSYVFIENDYSKI